MGSDSGYRKRVDKALMLGFLLDKINAYLDDQESPSPVQDETRVFGQLEHVLPAKGRTIMFLIWPSVILVQWLIVVPGSYVTGTMFEISGYPPSTRTVPFVQDLFFWTWNLAPFAIAASLWFVERSLSRTVLYGSAPGNVSKAKEVVAASVEKWRARVFNRPVLALTALFALGSCALQFKTLGDRLQSKDLVYWWHPEFSSLVFYTRLVALFVDMFCLVVAVLLIAAMLCIFSRLVRERLWKHELLCVDGCGGLMLFGRTAIAFALVPFLLGVVGLIGNFEHKGHSLLQWLGDIFLILVASGFAFGIVLLPLRPIHSAMLRAKAKACALLVGAIRRAGPHLPEDPAVPLSNEAIEALKEDVEARDALLSVFSLYRNAPTWPFNFTMAIRLGGIAAGPLAVLLLDIIKDWVLPN